MNKTFNRRMILRGLGGAAVAAPFLSSVAERQAKADGTTAAAPKRLIVYFTHYGCLTDRWFPAKSHGALTKADYMGMQTLAPMADYADKLLMVRGIRAMNEWSFAGTLGQTTDPHTQVCGSFFTCQPVTPDDGKFNAAPTGRSLDHVCAEQVNPGGGSPLLLQIGGVAGSKSNTQAVISYSAAQTIFPGYGTPTAVFNSLMMTNFGKGSSPTPDTYAIARGKSIVDIVRDDLNGCMRQDMSGSDKKKLNDWMALLDQTTTNVVSNMCTADTATKLGATSTSVAAAEKANSDVSVSAPIMFDLAVLSAICDANRVIFLKMPPSYTFKFLNLTTDSHGLSHRIGTAFMGGSCVSGVMDMIYKVDQWYAQQFASLLGKLNGIQEGNGTLLDNSATVWFQEMSDGDSHNLNNLPILQAGSCGGYFKTGQAINVEKAATNLTVGHSDDDCKNGSTVSNLDSAGTPPDQATMPINKYFCNLMNAIGVKADATGFPVKGGTMPVTKFGKYDDSKLFKNAGAAAASITNQGEYTELKA